MVKGHTVNRWTALAVLTATIWLAMSVGAIIILILGTGWAMATVITEAVCA